MDFVLIVILNYVYFGFVKMVFENGFYVVCDKFFCFNIEEVEELVVLVESIGLIFVLMYNYMGYLMVKQVCEMICYGEFGEIRKVVVEYL